MATQDKCCTIVPYFKVPAENMAAYRKLCEQFVEKSATEPKCLFYGFSFDGNQAHCREGYADALAGRMLKESRIKVEKFSRLGGKT